MLSTLQSTRTWVVAAFSLVLIVPVSALAQQSVLRLRLNGPVHEAPIADAELIVLFGGEKSTTLRTLVDQIYEAAKDREIHGIALIVEQPQMSMAQGEEVIRALQGFRERGKKVYAYLDHGNNLSYVLATAADHITLAEYGELGIAGLHAEIGFYKGLLEKIGVKADLVHAGAYKAALEPYTRTEPSEAFAENINWLLDGIYERWIELMADGRGLSIDKMKALVDQAPVSADDALSSKLVDAVGSFHDFSTRIRKEFGKDVKIIKKYPQKTGLDFDLDPSNPFALFTQVNKIMETFFGAAQVTDKPGIGLIYVVGGIVVGKSQADMFSGITTAGSATIRAALEKARADDNIKAVVLRVNSPGGSALASDIMWKAATRLAAEKPLIVSMGGVAGSGGYYVSLPADRIFAEQTTITASIGVVGGKLVWKELMEDKLGITTTEFNRGKNAGLMSMNKVWTESEREVIHGWLDDVYAQFKGRVMTSRGDRLKGELEDMAAGRVYTGGQALELGLIDEIGGLGEAIRFAAKKATLADYEVYLFPKPKEFADIFRELMGEPGEDDYEISLAAFGSNNPLTAALLPLVRQLAPQQLRNIAGGLRNLIILNDEHIGCFMPFDMQVR